MSVTLKDIAKRANVSISTVSRIINDDKLKPASEKTKQKVWEIIRELGYMPNKNARNLVKGLNEDSEESNRTKSIGCIFTSTSDTYKDPFFSQIAWGIQSEASKQGYAMGYSYSSCDMTQSALYNNLTSNKVDGGIVMGRFSRDFLEFLRKNIKNLVYAGINYVNGGFDEVICDGFKGSCCAVQYLVELGHKKIAYIGTIPGEGGIDILNEYRFEGYKHVMRQNGININREYVKNIYLSTEEGYRGMKEMLDECTTFPTAVFCANDSVAIGAMKAILEKGLRIPEDISVIGIDDIDMAAYVRPSLTTIHVPKEELGRFAVKLLIDRIEKGHSLPVRIDIPFKLIKRESCRKI